MCDTGFDLSLALDSSCTLNGMAFGADCHQVVKGGAGSTDRCCDHALEVEISHAPNMRTVANLIIALERMKHGHKLMSTEFSNRELLNIMMESVVEERVTLEVQNPTCSRAGTFVRSRRNRDVLHAIRTTEQRRLVRSEDNLKLYAMALQSMTLQDREFRQRIVHLTLSTYTTFSSLGDQGQPIALGIAHSNLYLSCAIKSDKPFLQLEEVNSKTQLESINAEGDLVRFLFFKSSHDLSSSMFESAKFCGWFISTMPEYDAPVEMCTMESADRLTSFIVKHPESFDMEFSSP